MRKILMAVALISAGACGDNDTNDNRGYTKAPLEEPTVLIKGEDPSPMAALGDPIYPEAPMIEPEERKTAQPAAPAGGAQPKAGAVPAGATQADVDAGSTIFGATGNCFTCHGQNGTGGALAPALNDSKWLNIDGSFATTIAWLWKQLLENGAAVRSCQTEFGATGGKAYTTIEGLSADGSHPIQRAWIEEDVAQCGYCQPGMMLELRALLTQKPSAKAADIDAALGDHVCRCGSYPRIRKAALLAVRNGGGR